MPGNFSIGDELSELVQDAGHQFQYNELKKTWPKYLAISTLVITTSVISLIKGCERERGENVSDPSAVHSSANLTNKDSRSLYALNFRDLTESYNLTEKKGDYDYNGLQ